MGRGVLLGTVGSAGPPRWKNRGRGSSNEKEGCLVVIYYTFYIASSLPAFSSVAQAFLFFSWHGCATTAEKLPRCAR